MSAQALEALEVANRRRKARAAFKRELSGFHNAGSARGFLASTLPVLGDDLVGMRVGELVGACYRTGPAATRTILNRARLSPVTRVNQLSGRELETLQCSLRAAVDQYRAHREDVAFCRRCAKDTLISKRSRRCLWCYGETE